MFRNICGIIVLVALQAVLSVSAGGEVHEIQVQLVNLEIAKWSDKGSEKGLTVKPGEEIGYEKAKQPNVANSVSVYEAIKAILGLDGIAFFKSEREGGNYIVIRKELKAKFTVGSASRYRWSHGGDVKEKPWEKTSVKIVTSVDEYGDFLKITQTALDFNLGILGMTFGAANPGEFCKEKSKVLNQEFDLYTTTFFKLREQYMNKIFTPEFKDDTLKKNEVLKLVKLKITGFTVYTGGKNPFVINSMTQEVGMYETLLQYNYRHARYQPTPYDAVQDPNFTYTIVFTYTPLE